MVAVSLKKKKFNSILSFFFQAEDGIRDSMVTGVQTCALPIFKRKGELMFCVEGVPVREEFGAGFVPVNIFGYNPNIARNENIKSYHFHGIDFRGGYPKVYFRSGETYDFHYIYKPKEDSSCRCEITPIMFHANHFGGAVDDAKKDNYEIGRASCRERV